MVESALNFFFDIIKWVFNDFLIDIKILGISVLYYFLAIMVLGFIILGLINSVSAGNVVGYASRSRRRSENKELRNAKLKKVRGG